MIVNVLPVMLIGMVFGLAMDYQVFLVTRMREEHVRGASPTGAAVAGLAHGSRVVTAAAIIMIFVFAGFLLSATPMVQSFGFALAAAVLFDAFVVRMTIVPAVMALLGRAGLVAARPPRPRPAARGRGGRAAPGRPGGGDSRLLGRDEVAKGPEMPPKQGLRELKKARTRAAIQREALRLFRERGYEATTVEQVAQAAEVAHTTVFRYFPTKEDLVISDEADPLIFASLRAQPPELTPVQALRAAMLDVLGGFTPEDLAAGRDRAVLILSVPALRGAAFANFVDTMRTVTAILAEREGRAPGDIRTLIGAAFGIMLDVMLRWEEDPSLDLLAALDEALATLG
ncbi:TetR/AcrR family transcriptional regulator [Actinomadura madurae]|uniref:TetR/AcrR family transcriptional regulator n=2 Tax=Actinomadura madurae TaxID=1993 RepID=UPI0020D253DF|nr:MMPL family transporter [Actinomadura madurae]